MSAVLKYSRTTEMFIDSKRSRHLWFLLLAWFFIHPEPSQASTPKQPKTRTTRRSAIPPTDKNQKRKPPNRKKRRSKQTATLKGHILEKGKREPIEGAMVFIRKLRKSVYTNAKGEYRFNLSPGPYKIVVKSIGYLGKKLSVKIKQSKTLDIYIAPDPDNPLQSVVRAKRVQKSSQQLGASREEMKYSAGVIGGDPFRFFQSLPGVARASRTSGTFLVRGADFADTGFFIDGHRLPILYHFGAGLTVISRRFLDRIDFFPGGSPLRFGRLTGGLISGHSRTPKVTSVHGEVYVSIANAGFYLEIPIGKRWSISAAASRSYIDAFYSLITKDPLVGAFWDYQFKVAYQSRRHQFSLFIFGSDDSYDYAGKSDDAPEVPLIGRFKINRALRFLRMITKYSYRRGPFSIRASLAAGFNQDLSDTADKKDEVWKAPIELRVDASLKLNKQAQLEFGLDGIWGYQSYNFRIPSNETNGFPKPILNGLIQTGQGQTSLLAPALYVALLWKPYKGAEIRLGARGDLTLFQEKLLVGLDPRMSATFSLNKSLKGLFSVGLFHRPPLPNEWSAERGNPDLSLLQALQIAGGFEYHYKRAINVRMQFFYSQMFGLVVPSEKILSVGGKFTPERFNNTGYGRAYGLETLIRFRIVKRLSGFISYTLSRAERGHSSDGSYSLYEFDQPHIMNLMLRWRIGSGWSVSTRFRLASGNPVPSLNSTIHDADTDNYRPTFGGNDKERLPMFHQLDLRVDKVFIYDTWKLGIYLDILNVYRAKNAEEYRYSYNYKTRRPIAGLPVFPAFGIRGEF